MPDADPIDHDHLFKELLREFFDEFIELFFPDVSAYMERGTHEFLDKEIFTDVTAGERYEPDLVVKARFRELEAFFLIHIENQAKPHAEFGRRMFRYFARLFELHGLPVYPIVIFSYDRPLRPEPDTFRVEFPDWTVLDFRFRVIQLNRLNWRDYVRQPNPVASALMAKMKIVPEDRPKVKLECLRLLATLKLNPAKMKLISGFVDSYLRLSAAEQPVFEADLEAILPAEKEQVMEIVTSWMLEGIEKGKEIGIEEGKEIGIEQGKEDMILRQLRRKFGEISEELEQRVRSLKASQLDELADALLDFQTLSEAEEWLADHA